MHITTKNLNLFHLLLAGSILSLVMLHSNELWTMESRWATVCWLMLRNHDYLHPYLFSGLYYDKPLLSYWLIVGLAQIFGKLNEWALRLPSAVAAITSVYCVYRLGKILFNAKTGIIAGWLLITTYFFIVWSRIASADMLNVAGILLALTWYLEHQEKSHFSDYFVFFIILALTSLCKGLAGFIIPIIGVTIDIVLDNKWKQHLNWKFFTTIFIAAIIYLAPFIASTLTINTHSLQASGINEVFSENIQRYFVPFDHQNPWYTYFVYIPFYLLPWIVLVPFALKWYIKQWRNLQYNQRWLFIFVIAIFMFFSLSGSRRGYYILPLIPFIILIISDWICGFFEQHPYQEKYRKLFFRSIICCYGLFFSFFAIIQPIINHTSYGSRTQKLANIVNTELERNPNIKNRNIYLLNSKDNSLVFYLHVGKNASVITIDQEKLIYVIKNSLKIIDIPVVIIAKRELTALSKEVALKNVPYKVIVLENGSEKDDVVLLPLK